MKRNILPVILLSSVFLLSGCGLITWWFYGQIIKPTETWYFSKGFDKKIDKSGIKTVISDSSNISKKAFQLIRYNKEKIVSYWIDLDTTYLHDNNIRIKIVDSSGCILRYLDSWLVPDLDKGIDYNEFSFSEDKKGNVIILSNGIEYGIFHSGDMMGLHHFDFSIPKNIIKKASLQYDWNGYNYINSWITYEGLKEDFHFLYKYSYEGELIDSFYVTIKPEDFRISDNFFIQYKDWNPEKQSYIINSGKIYFIEPDFKPFGGYGKDEDIIFINPIIHSFNTNGYLNNISECISFGKSIEAFDWMRNKSILSILNNTVKSIGYSKFISKSEFNDEKYDIRNGYLLRYNERYSLKDLNDSLIFYYSNNSAPIYYQEFWERRKSEDIENVVFKILKDIQKHYSGQFPEIDNRFVNDTLKTLLIYDLDYQTAIEKEKPKILIDYFEYLNGIGLKQSAYNLIFLSSVTDSINLDREEIYNNLEINKKFCLIDNKKYFLNMNKPKWIEDK